MGEGGGGRGRGGGKERRGEGDRGGRWDGRKEEERARQEGMEKLKVEGENGNE